MNAGCGNLRTYGPTGSLMTAAKGGKHASGSAEELLIGRICEGFV